MEVNQRCRSELLLTSQEWKTPRKRQNSGSTYKRCGPHLRGSQQVG
jgi:hypothetical protein